MNTFRDYMVSIGWGLIIAGCIGYDWRLAMIAFGLNLIYQAWWHERKG